MTLADQASPELRRFVNRIYGMACDLQMDNPPPPKNEEERRRFARFLKLDKELRAEGFLPEIEEK